MLTLVLLEMILLFFLELEEMRGLCSRSWLFLRLISSLHLEGESCFEERRFWLEWQRYCSCVDGIRLRKEGLRCLLKRSALPELEYWGDCMFCC